MQAYVSHVTPAALQASLKNNPVITIHGAGFDQYPAALTNPQACPLCDVGRDDPSAGYTCK
jgi:hypothetical protein